jgi:curved DNA-binding protein
MAVKFRDYYEVLGVPRTGTQDEIQRSYRKLARKYHPDVNKAKDAEDKFKEINEAYEVLKDPEKRQKYDQLGPNWKAGQEFRPPPGWDVHFDFGSGGGGQSEFQWGGTGGFSDFFETIFGGQRFRDAHRSGAGRPGQGPIWAQAGSDQEAVLRISLEKAFLGATEPIKLQMQSATPEGQLSVQEKNYEVKIPAGIMSGQKIRLTGQGGQGTGGGPRGDLYLKVEIDPHPVYRMSGRDLTMDLPVAPWEAVLGAEVRLMTLAGEVTLKVPPGTQSGRKLRLRGKGMPNPKGGAGDLYALVAIVVPKEPSGQERELFEKLQQVSSFKPRS